ncbi:MAG: Catalase, partial [Gemmatimonadetes bacterium]|nr:Catalase [Gemmatimonadota bacterium]
TLFWNSQSPAEKEHIIAAFQFELSKVVVPSIRQRVVDNLAHVDPKLARKVAEPLGIGAPDPRAAAGRSGFRDARFKLPIEASATLSMETAGGPIQTRKVAILVADGVDGAPLLKLHAALTDAGAVPRFVGPRLGSFSTTSGATIEADASMENSPAVLFDALVLPSGEAAVKTLGSLGQTMEFVTNQYRHGKAILALGSSRSLLGDASIPAPRKGGKADAGLLPMQGTESDLAERFIAAIAAHRFPERETDPPAV